jgi:glycosyltransferase involved in cell wall biosynthesis
VRWLGIRAVLTIIRRIDGYIFLTSTQMEMYRGFGVPSQMPQTVIANPVRLAVAEPGHFQSRDARLRRGELVRLITVGALNDQKNHLLLLEALAKLDRRFTLSIVGGGEREPVLRSHVGTRGLHDRVEFLGPREDIQDLLDAHDIFVLSSDYEASPLVILEAMVRGLPVVSTDCAANSQELGEAHQSFWVVPLKDADALAAAVEKAVGNRASIHELERTGRAVLNQHCPRRAAQDHLNFFQRLGSA